MLFHAFPKVLAAGLKDRVTGSDPWGRAQGTRGHSKAVSWRAYFQLCESDTVPSEPIRSSRALILFESLANSFSTLKS